MSLDFLNRLRPGSFIAPSITEQTFLTNTVTKSGGKKISTMEIIDSDESVSQDHGNKTDTFPVSMYFTGDDFDTQVTNFEKLLKEKYDQDFPGFLRHPLWGDIDVFPVSWELSIQLVEGVGIGRIDVEFIEVFPRKYPESDIDSSDLASSDLDKMQDNDSSSNLFTKTVSAAKNIKSKVETVVNVINKATEFIETVEEEAEAIQAEINELIDDVAGGITQLLFAVQRLMRLPSRIKDSTLNKINTYFDMCSDIITGVSSGSADEINNDNQKNNAILMEVFAGFAVGCLAESALYTDFSVRTDTIASIEIINDALDNYNTAMSDIRATGDDITKDYSGDHNLQMLLTDVTARVNDVLLNVAFSLKAEKRITLNNQSDILTLCYEYYDSIDNETVEYFINTNNIKNDEFIELPRGREIIIYV